MKSICRRLSSRRGESLVESMAAILVLSFASLIFISMVSSAGWLNAQIKADEIKYQEAREPLEQKDESFHDHQRTVEITYGTSEDNMSETLCTVSVEFYQDNREDTSELYAFYLPTEAPGG